MDEKHDQLQASLRHSGYQLVYRIKLAGTTENIWSYLTDESGLSLWIPGCDASQIGEAGEQCLPDGTSFEWCELLEKELISFKYKKKEWTLFSYVMIRLIPANEQLVIMQIMQENIPDMEERHKLKETIENVIAGGIFSK